MATSNIEASSQSFTFSAKRTAEVASPSPFRYEEGNPEDVFHSLLGRYVGNPGSLLRGEDCLEKILQIPNLSSL